jgi:hypothetical protein
VLWEEVRKALAAAAWTSERGMYRFAWTRFERELAADGRRVLRQRPPVVRSELGPQPFVSIPPEVLAREGFVRVAVDSITYAAPDAGVLLSDAFLDTHCFTLDQRAQGGEQLIGLRFEPIPGRRLPDIEGVLWLGRQTLRLRSVEYRYVNLPWMLDRHNAGGEVYFRGLPNGTWIVNEWTIRMLRLRESRDEFGRVREHQVLGYNTEGSVVNVVATTDGTVVDRETGLGGVRGVVADSAGRPVSGARVWIQDVRGCAARRERTRADRPGPRGGPAGGRSFRARALVPGRGAGGLWRRHRPERALRRLRPAQRRARACVGEPRQRGVSRARPASRAQRKRRPG